MLQALTSAAYELYNKMVFVSINTDEFPKWASRFVPLGYRQKVLGKLLPCSHFNLIFVMGDF